MLAKRKISCKEIKEIDILDFLMKLGFAPCKINDKEAWFYSPLKPGEKVASFRINRQRQLYYDYSLGEGGDIIRLGCRIFNCSISELLYKLQNHDFSFRQPISITEVPNKIIVRSIGDITKADLVQYVIERGLDIGVVKNHCKQINYSVGNLNFNSIGFQNIKGGWELRSRTFKGATSKEISISSHGNSSLCVFEGFFDTLSFIQLNESSCSDYDLLTLNSLALLNNAISLLNRYREINLYLDNDVAGKGATQKLLGLNIGLTVDHSSEYSNYKDLNEFVTRGSGGVSAR